MNLIETENLCKIYKRPQNELLKAVDNVSIKIPQEKTYGLVGESGSGKSTLGMMIAKLLKSDSGKILLNGKDINNFTKQEEKDFRKKVQIVFQNSSDSLNPKMTVKKIIEEPLIIHKNAATKAERKYLVNEIRTLCGLENSVMDRYPSELSGGQRQRVSIASSMIIKPEFLILDEAVSSLDVLIQAQILNLLKLMQKSFGTTYLFISHNLNVISYMSDIIGVMKDGKIVEEGAAQKLLSSPSHPYTKKLFDI